MCDYAIRRRARSPKTNITPDNKLEYPTHPFPPALARILATLPQGFSDMALKSMLSYPVIQLLHRIRKTMDKGPTAFPKDTSVAVEIMRLSMATNISAVEKATVTLSFVFARLLYDVSTKEYRVNSSERTYRSMKEPLEKLAAEIFGLAETAGQDFVVWGVFLLASAKKEHGLPESLRDNILLKMWANCRAVRRYEDFKESVAMFFWHDNLVSTLSEVWKRMLLVVEQRRSLIS